MAKERATYLSNINGRIGNIVIRNYRNGVVAAVRPRKSGKAPSEAQLAQRERFKAANGIAAALGAALNASVHPLPQEMLGARNVFVKKNFRHVTVSDDGVVEVDYSKLQLSGGPLPSPAFQTPTYADDLTVTVAYSPASDVPGSSESDEVFIVVLQPDMNQAVLSAAGLRKTGSLSVKVPAVWSGTEVHVYGFAVGRAKKNWEQRSCTVYLGKGTVE